MNKLLKQISPVDKQACIQYEKDTKDTLKRSFTFFVIGLS